MPERGRVDMRRHPQKLRGGWCRPGLVRRQQRGFYSLTGPGFRLGIRDAGKGHKMTTVLSEEVLESGWTGREIWIW